ncbi:conserved hypothetical protein [Leadbettera azotonutricia ZAS-9]|uniref:Uncharacterized protein n=1 Tax=Leadbettera azotonutricia (strain ATCC BAA-888 / DSM 13862 / ZAS-9) TaxID=545695 RepID=F5YA53_LEAAZ|nr:conserved hypothetical protein [Leadbettera azotonutricia ZAS-9]
MQSLIAKHDLKNKVELGGVFCMGKCDTGVSVTVDKAYHSVQPENVEAFFKEAVLKKLA